MPAADAFWDEIIVGMVFGQVLESPRTDLVFEIIRVERLGECRVRIEACSLWAKCCGDD